MKVNVECFGCYNLLHDFIFMINIFKRAMDI